ncbi:MULTISPECIES: formyltransferase family protein [Campylobacter]|uniref:Formyltransferase family protein n=1 Tax=Campylobacter vicugnae TaxID=1660076 RepID=A0ABZ2E887_9BACT|nr:MULTISPECIES: formyltransferase family protein [unclassified Campylobacter]ARR03379.1 formyltransferase domain-containing protein [Campylobacter sp. RM12175]MCR8690802.1 methionyl-tRNA formyltransferase [Campylobacter sp. RM9264]MCR8701840.1 methionyl-tRNA formyltransferase [Campylobacter sp. RM12176]
MKIAILTTANQWFEPYALRLQDLLSHRGFDSQIYNFHEQISGYDVVFILSYHRIINKEFLIKNRHNIVIHASDLPRGSGWSPMFWQILEGKNDIVFTLFEADSGVDSGDYYLKESLKLSGLELNDELRELQANMCIEMSLKFIINYKNLTPIKQIGERTFYPKRSPKDSQLDPNLSLNELFNQLRIASNDEYPAYFYKDKKKFILKIYSQDES